MGLTCGGESGLDCDTLKASLESGAGVDELARKLVRFRFRVATDCLTACLSACLAAWLPSIPPAVCARVRVRLRDWR